jgi:calcineurin-like phosphoesterase family protein
MINIQGQAIWLNHYPMRAWNGSHRGSWHLYGHVHGALHAEDQANLHWLTRDVGVDACDFEPVSFEQLAAYMQPRLEFFALHQAEVYGQDV